MPRIENWSVKSDIYKAPEQGQSKLSGHVYGHDRIPDGDKVTTSRITAAEGRRITTASGTVYELGTPEPAYAAWVLANTGKPIDDAAPIKVFSEEELACRVS